MNKEWSELNKTMQMQIKSRNSFYNGIMTLLLLRKKLMGQIAEFENTLTKEHILKMLIADIWINLHNSLKMFLQIQREKNLQGL